MTIIKGRWAVAIAGVLAVSACTGEERAAAALKEAEEVITGHHAEAIRYAPDAFKAVMAAYDTARKSLEASDYRGAIAGARAATEGARELPAAIAAGRQRMAEGWNAVNKEVTEKLAALEARVKALDGARRLPGGVARADVAAAKEELPALKQTLADAARAFERGRLAEAMHAGTQLRDQVSALAERLGLPVKG